MCKYSLFENVLIFSNDARPVGADPRSAKVSSVNVLK